ncbi:PIN domain-containing protein [Methylobacter tundripaludum]|uniref:PIN domain-containing protein n=1 Tax=Methylobacter tundripaludum TaxID=173365 RepID=UPI001268DA60|nr:PIN domain-containing protein [Methylobacter tundripaludum]
MNKIKRDQIHAHIVVPDTNILWDKDKKNSVSPEFGKFWVKNLKLIPLELVVPEVVLGELHFQQATSAMKLASSITSQIAELSGIAEANYYSPAIHHENIKKHVFDKLHKWVKSLKGSVAVTPIDEIEWSEMVQNSIWRKPPFTTDPKDQDNEKGFRDALILETLISVCTKNKTTPKNIVFICNDYLLRETALQRLKHNKEVLIFESLDDFDSYIQLTQEKLTDKFVKSIQNRARLKFHSTPNNNNCIFYRENLTATISKQFAADLSLPANTPGLGMFPPISQPSFLSSTRSWQLSSEKWWIGATRFKQLIAPNEYHWVSRVIFVRLLSTAPVASGILAGVSSLAQSEQLQTFNFDVNWKANVKTNGTFYDVSVINIDKAEFLNEPPSDELLTRWKLYR